MRLETLYISGILLICTAFFMHRDMEKDFSENRH